MEYIEHPWDAIYNKESKILILGSMPSPKSREVNFYYGHPQNIFWKTLAQVLEDDEPENSPDARREFLIKNKIAVWDVLASCEIKGARDESIKNAKVNDFHDILNNSKIKAIFTTGKAATELFNKKCSERVGREAIYLPSTSPANRAQQAKSEFMEKWRQIKLYL
ncbi:DNA-deoxyinosine glycosylase [Anaerovorax odorimutans]|uniref:DNA-deoxyinosine glycosylase n=1 Tax=Anaerovorax odorimutans TaxID=109327 RepID=UPI0003FED619|nr:DNA-deoxyinosine glycosylase [Anaerovorax odorimutans]